MNKYYLIISLLLLTLLLFINCNNNTNRSMNNISIDTPVDWGESMEGDIIKKTNASQQPI
jgi:YbbR domain-containing protein